MKELKLYIRSAKEKETVSLVGFGSFASDAIAKELVA